MTSEMQNKIIIEGLRLYAYHGVLPQERKVGAYFTIDAEITTDFSSAIETDDLRGTLNYADISSVFGRSVQRVQFFWSSLCFFFIFIHQNEEGIWTNHPEENSGRHRRGIPCSQ